MANKHIKRNKRKMFNVNAFFQKTAEINIGGKKRIVYPVKLTTALVAIFLMLSLVFSYIFSGRGTNAVEISYEKKGEYKATAAGDLVALSNNKGAFLINDKGKIEHKIEKALSEPTISAEGDYLLLYDMAGNHFAAGYKNGKEKAIYDIENDIISAKITKNGYSVFATDTDGYRARVVIFDKKGKEIYEWKSGSEYVADVAISESGRYLAVAQFSMLDKEIVSKISFIDTKYSEMINSYELKNEIIAGIEFTGGKKLIAVTDCNLLGLSNKGKELFKTSLVGKNPSFYDLRSDDIIGIVVHDNRGNSVLEFYSMGGKLRGSYLAGGEIRALSVRGKSAVIVEQGAVMRISASGKVKKECRIAHDIKDIALFEKSNRALVIGATSSEVIGVR